MANGKAGPPTGNNNATKGRAWYNALSKELTGNKNAPKLRKLAKKLIEKAQEGEGWALKEIGDRLDGKPAQTIQGPGDDGSFLITLSTDDNSAL